MGTLRGNLVPQRRDLLGEREDRVRGSSDHTDLPVAAAGIADPDPEIAKQLVGGGQVAPTSLDCHAGLPSVDEDGSLRPEYPLVWRVRVIRPEWFGRRCRIVIHAGRRGARLIEFEDGYRVVCPGQYLRKAPACP